METTEIRNDRVEWALERTWPDGDMEHEGRDSRADAERGARGVALNEDDRSTARAVKRTVTVVRTVTPWVSPETAA